MTNIEIEQVAKKAIDDVLGYQLDVMLHEWQAAMETMFNRISDLRKEIVTLQHQNATLKAALTKHTMAADESRAN
jgi:hypothetical protein